MEWVRTIRTNASGNCLTAKGQVALLFQMLWNIQNKHDQEIKMTIYTEIGFRRKQIWMFISYICSKNISNLLSILFVVNLYTRICKNSDKQLVIIISNKGWFIHYVHKFFRKTNISYSLIRTLIFAYQGVRDVSFPKKFSYIINWWPLGLFYIRTNYKGIS